MGISFLLIAKGFVVFAFFLYLIFSFVVVKQISMMTSTLEVESETPIRILGWIHVLFAAFVLLLAVFIL